MAAPSRLVAEDAGSPGNAGFDSLLDAAYLRPGKPTLPEVLPLVKGYYELPGNGAGGSLHIVLDDGNIHLGHVEFCREYAQREGDEEGFKLASIIMRMSRTQRSRLSLY